MDAADLKQVAKVTGYLLDELLCSAQSPRVPAEQWKGFSA